MTCNRLAKPSLSVIKNTKAGCPVDLRICRNNDSNIYLDAGLLDSNLDLGINPLPSRSFLCRTTAHCAPIKTKDYQRLANVTNLGKSSS